MSERTTNFTDQNFRTEVLESSTPVLVDAHATWCPPCRALAPVIDELAEEFDGRVKVGKLDIDENGETAASYEVASIPTVLVFRDGRLTEKVVGLQPKEHYQALLERAVA